MSFHFVLFYVCRLCLHLLFFKIYFIFLVACGIKPTSTCFQVLSSSPTQGGAGDRGGVCLPAGGTLDCSQSSIFPQNRRDQAHSLTGGHFGFKCTGFSLGMTIKSTFGALDPRGPHIWTILRKNRGQWTVWWPASKHPACYHSTANTASVSLSSPG